LSEPIKSSDSGVTTLKAAVESLPGRVFKQGALTIIAAVTVGCVATGSTLIYAQSKLDDVKAGVARQIDGGISPVGSKLDEHIREERIAREQLQLDVAQIRRDSAVKEERDAARFDLLYRTILTRQPQPEAAELAAPMRDGGR
jgi:hypothetical protein